MYLAQLVRYQIDENGWRAATAADDERFVGGHDGRIFVIGPQ
ncbi:MAG: hypothetical protein ACI9MX_001836 [Candidatus Aldehydirespiratoraceae bacterium]|jgi:hypothetical protein